MEHLMSKGKHVFELTPPNAAGIDIGAASHFVAVPPDRDDEPVREFSSFTVDLNRLADWLTACEVDTVAMESTGGYWIALFELLESRGFTVDLVNARHVKNVSGRKRRRARLPVVAAVDELWLVGRGVSAPGRPVRATHGGAPARDAAQLSSPAYPAHAKGPDADEHATGSSHF
jgi:hypothetical protein